MKMIPAMCPESTRSNAEREVFELLDRLDLPGVVLYSLQLHKHVDKIQSEIDFVVITNRGVLCLEVKGGEVNYSNGVWEFGSGGDGKTQKKESPFEQAKAGYRVLFICFNKLLADWVDKEINYRLADVNNKVKVINFHNLLLEVVGCDIPNDNLSKFYNEELPAQFLEKIEYEPLDEADLLIIDEGQDLFMADYILCLDKMVKGGLENGRWITFYDEFQNIYLRRQFIEGVEMMRSFSPFMGTLETNYRNTRQIHDANHKITNIENGRFNGIDGDEVAYFGYQNNEEAKKELKNIVKSLVKQKVSFEDIVILSPYKFHHSIIEGNRYLFQGITQIQPMQNEKGDITKLVPGTIRFSTIYSFKGRESHVIILIDINKQDEEAMRLYYTGISRAKSKLFVLYDKNKFSLN